MMGDLLSPPYIKPVHIILTLYQRLNGIESLGISDTLAHRMVGHQK
jgi:hypothetical protein